MNSVNQLPENVLHSAAAPIPPIKSDSPSPQALALSESDEPVDIIDRFSNEVIPDDPLMPLAERAANARRRIAIRAGWWQEFENDEVVSTDAASLALHPESGEDRL